jgi:hypothetical protein
LPFFVYGESEDGGLEEFEESLPSRACNAAT